MLVAVTDEAKSDFTRIAASFGLSVPMARALVSLEQPCPMSELADQLACDRSYVTSIADHLEQQDLAERAPGTDRRVKLLQLTQRGETVRNELTQAIAERALVLRRLNDEQRRSLRPLLEALTGDAGR